MNSTPQTVPEKSRGQWLLGIIGLLIIPGMFWLAVYLTSYPEEAMVFAKKYGGFIWIALALAWSIQCLTRRKKIQK